VREWYKSDAGEKAMMDIDGVINWRRGKSIVCGLGTTKGNLYIMVFLMLILILLN